MHSNFRKQFNMTEKDFLDGLQRDKLKQDYCNSNNIPLYIIKYNEDINKKMETIL